MLKYGDSLYRCKRLKIAGLGRMATCVRKLKPSLSYLEEVRKHMGRLPSIDPFTRTILMCGFPNVGKSSFVNNITNANVEVQPYAFTTQSLYVGHTDYNNVKWQVIDSPGILDRDLNSRNTIEMQSITALAHLKACILYLMDISETGGYTIPQQIRLFSDIKPLFANKPHILVLTKIDIQPYDTLADESKALIEAFVSEHGVKVVQLSNNIGDTIFQVKQAACDLLLDFRLKNEEKNVSRNKVLKMEEDYLKGITVFKPQAPRDNKTRPAYTPDNFAAQSAAGERVNIRQMQEENGGAGVFVLPPEERYIFEKDEWKFDVIPEIYNGKNVIDFVDPDIEEKLAELEAEEDQLLKELEGQIQDEDEVPEEYLEAHEQVKQKIGEKRVESVINSHKKVNSKYKSLSGLKEKLQEKGLDSSGVSSRFANEKGKARARVMKKLLGVKGPAEMDQEEAEEANNRMVDEEDTAELQKRHKGVMRSMSRNRSIPVQRELTPSEQVSTLTHHRNRRSSREELKEPSAKTARLESLTARSTTGSPSICSPERWA